MTTSRTGTFAIPAMHDVRSLANSPEAIRSHANLDWNPLLVPLEMRGQREHRTYSIRNSSRYAIVNSRTGDVIDGGNPVSEGFTLHPNGAILESVCTLATDAGLTITRAGALYGGEQVIIEMPLGENLPLRSILDSTRSINDYAERNEARRNAGAAIGDFLSGSLILSISHVPGRATRGCVRGERLACFNGAVIAAEENFLRLTHREHYDAAQVRSMVERFRGSLQRYTQQYGRLVDQPANKALQALHITRVTEEIPFLDSIIESTLAKYPLIAAVASNPMRGFIDAILERDEAASLLLNHVRDNGSRATCTILDTILDSQPGIEHVRGTLAQSYNALTDYHSHNYGRSADSRAEANLRGIAAERQTKALTEGLSLLTILNPALTTVN